MYDLVRIEKVNAVASGLPFVCSFCGKEHQNWDYLRVWLKGTPNPRSIHLRCLLNVVGFTKDEIATQVVIPRMAKMQVVNSRIRR